MKFEKLARRYAPTFNHILDDELHIRPLALSTPKILIAVSREERRSSARKPITPVGHRLGAAASVADAISIRRPKCLGEAFYWCSAFLYVSMRLAENIWERRRGRVSKPTGRPCTLVLASELGANRRRFDLDVFWLRGGRKGRAVTQPANPPRDLTLQGPARRGCRRRSSREPSPGPISD